jgi:chromosomal replication initiation ATPase DnaA
MCGGYGQRMTESIVLTVCQELKIHPHEFFGSGRDHRLVRARRIAIKRLRAAGFSMAGIARMMKRNYSTIRYWVHPKLRKHHNEYARNYWRQRSAA